MYPQDVLWPLMAVPALATADLGDEGAVQAFADALSERLLTSQDKSVLYDVFVRQIRTRLLLPRRRRTAHSVATDTVLSRGFYSAEYRALRAVGEY